MHPSTHRANKLQVAVAQMRELSQHINLAQQELERLNDRLGMIYNQVYPIYDEMSQDEYRENHPKPEPWKAAEPVPILVAEQAVESPGHARSTQPERGASTDPVSSAAHSAPTMRQATIAAREREQSFRCQHTNLSKRGGCLVCTDCGEQVGG